jgi:hypothetical protein
MAFLSGSKMGIFGHFLGVKLKINYLSSFEGIFSIKSKSYFFQDPMQNFSPNGQAVFKLWPF